MHRQELKLIFAEEKKLRLRLRKTIFSVINFIGTCFQLHIEYNCDNIDYLQFMSNFERNSARMQRFPVVSQLSYKMHVTEENRINRVILKILGLWPYQQSYFARIQKVFFVIILSTFILVQLLVFITTQYSTNLLLKILSFVLPVLFCIVNYCTFIIRADSVKQMMEQNRDNWRIFEDKLEIDIIKKYSYIARLLTIIVMGFCCFLLIMHTILQFLPFILDIILPLNESRFYQPFFITEYFVNQEKYMYAILLHCVLAVNVGIIAVCSVSITILTYILHTCALLNIASYRIENAIEWSMLAISSPTREYLLYWRIVDGITIHRRAIEFTKFLSSKFTVLFAILIVIGVSSISLNLFQFLHLVTMNTNNITEILMCVLLLIALFTYMFSANYAGQILTDHGIKLFKATYNGIWYAAPLHSQKMLLFIMQIGMVNINLGCGSVFTASVEGFATLLNAAVSYCTMMYSTRQ